MYESLALFALVLFTDAAGAGLGVLRRTSQLPIRLLLVGSHTLAYVVACSVMLSILVHGVTANPWARAFGRRAKASESAASALGGRP